MFWFEQFENLEDARPLIARRRYGVIEVQAGQFASIRFKPWPKTISRMEISLSNRLRSGRNDIDRCRLYYNLPISTPGFLTIAYIESNPETSWKTARRAMETVDWIAEIRDVNAAVSELSNEKISDRLMDRLGWQTHCEHLSGRHFIKRYYGKFPKHAWLPSKEDPVSFAEMISQQRYEHACQRIGLVANPTDC